ncbi:MAG: hypothetical protein GY765_02830 [bacterium]|nr:hypothetical protein [bacterium]
MFRRTATRGGFSTKQQAAYGQKIGDADILFSHPTDSDDTVSHEVTKSDNSGKYGTGTEYATYQTNLTASTSLALNFDCSSFIAGLLAAFGCGQVVTSQPDVENAPNVYQHEFIPMDIDTIGKQLPCLTYVEAIDEALKTLYSDLNVKSFGFSGQSGEQLKAKSSLLGSGRKETSTIAMPPLVSTSFLRFVDSKLNWGADNFSALIKSFNFTHNNEFAEKDGYYPGSGYMDETAGSPQVRGRCLVNKRTTEANFKMLMEGEALEADSLTNTKKDLVFLAEGTPIITVNEIVYQHFLKIEMEAAIKSVKRGGDDGFFTHEVEALVLHNKAINAPFKITIQNTTPSYLAIAA